jgi:plastocyanin
VRIRPGQVVVWINEDPLAHTATADAGWDSGLLQEGQRFAHRFDAPGRHPFHCIPHPQMQGVIVVAED